MKTNYDRISVSRLIDSYNTATAKLQMTDKYQGLKHFDSLRENCLWRIAIETKMFEPDPRGKLTDDQWNQMIQFINQFQNEQAV